MMIGAVGGPVGGLFGGEAQDAAGLSDRAYKVRTAEGDVKELRSPNREFAVGDKVETRGNRVYEDRKSVV